MKKLMIVLAVLAVFGLATAAQATLSMSGSTYASPTHYQSYSSTAPSPFSTAGGGPFTNTLTASGGDRVWVGTGEYFYLENCEDNAVDTPGLTCSDPVSGPGGGYDSVDEDDGTINNQSYGTNRDVFHGSGANPTVTTFTFNAVDLGGQLPTYAGLVMTDGDKNGGATITITAYDSLNASLGSFSFVASDYFDNSWGSTSTAEDTFFGFYDAGGIAKIEGSVGGTGDFSGEYDHIQYGHLTVIPEPCSFALLALGLGGLVRPRKRK